MKHGNVLRMVLFDLFTGLLGLVLLLILDFRTPIKFDLRWFFIVGAVFCSALGFLRSVGAQSNPLVKAAIVSCGFGIPLLALSLTGMGLDAGILIAFLVVSFVSICCGTFARQKWSTSRRVASAILLLPIGCVTLASITLLPPLMARLSGQQVNLPSTEFSLTAEDGRLLTSPQLKGKVVVLAFWATWCEPCWHELPRVANVYANYRDNHSVIFFAVNAQAGGDTVEIARAYAEKMHIGLPVAYTDNQNAIRLGVKGYPMLILLAEDGHIRFIHDGYDASEEIESNLTREIGDLLNH